MMNLNAPVKWLVAAVMLLALNGGLAAAQSDPGGEAANRESCTVTCDTCPV